MDLAEYRLKPDVARVKARRLKQVFQRQYVFPFIHTSFQFENRLTVPEGSLLPWLSLALNE